MTAPASDCATVHFDTSGMTEEEHRSVLAYEEMIGLRRTDEEWQESFERLGKLEPVRRRSAE